jgi:1-acyl-sn-glycerol-3-phosphate acyltransferase
VPDRAVVIAANHSSHADTILLQFALSLRHRHPVLVAGGEDYWFSDPIHAAGATSIGVFPFPRHGDVGIRRARKALRMRATVVIFPQGTRAGGRFRSGVGRIAAGGLTEVVPVRIIGTDKLLPRGRLWPRRSGVEVVFGEPMRRRQSESAQEFADRLGHTVMHDLAWAS